MKRSLTLAKETLTELATAELAGVAAARGVLTRVTCPTGFTVCTVCDYDIEVTSLCATVRSCMTCDCG